MGLILAIKVFFRAFADGEGARRFLAGPSKESKAPCKEVQREGEYSHLRLLAHLQRSGRLIDFLKEDLSTFSDAQVGAAARKVHADCAKSLEDLVTVRPLFSDEEEGKRITIAAGYDPSEVKLTGNVGGQPPFQGILRHKGWKAHKHALPKSAVEGKREVLSPAEVEVR